MGMRNAKRKYMNNDLWDESVEKISHSLMRQQGEFSSEEIHLSVVCGNQLNIQIGRYKRGKIRMIGIIIECDNCDKAMAVDAEE